jgi:hypothetical protein
MPWRKGTFVRELCCEEEAKREAEFGLQSGGPLPLFIGGGGCALEGCLAFDAYDRLRNRK